MRLDIVIMAAGKGTRMKSDLPKVLHKLGGRPLLRHVLDTAALLGADQTLVITGHGADKVEAELAKSSSPQTAPRSVRQQPQLGTGHAIQQVAPHLGGSGTTLILNGDVPLIGAATARALVDACGGERLALLTIKLADPTGYGRIVRDDAGGGIRAIVEHKDADTATRAINEVYTGVMAAPTAALSVFVM
jgi:bifunctional UDP-N-acetylglucosamine pyrophosphorylase/glucosamine-1-phosphate N-acetyltransferase